MKNFYYFSKNRLKFVEIKNFYRKFIFLVLFFSILSSFLIFSAYFVVNEFINPNSKVKALQEQNLQLKNELNALISKYDELNSKVDELSDYNNELRLAVNLEPIKEEDRNFGDASSRRSKKIRIKSLPPH